MLERLHAFLQKNRCPIQGKGLLLGVSGGVDSVVMLSLLKKCDVRCWVVHCNFHLRGEESNRDEDFVKELCARWSVPLYVKHFDTLHYASQQKISVEMAARELRYHFFEQFRKEKQLDYICVAHHRDDSTETLLLNLIRGTGFRGLRGIQPIRGKILRPLLCFSRKEIGEHAQREKLDFVEDTTNQDERYLRNRIRHTLLPMLETFNPKIRETLFQTSQNVSRSYDLYQFLLEDLKKRCISYEGEKEMLHLNDLGDVPLEPFLHYWLSPYGFSSADVEDLSMKERRESGKRFFSSSYEILKNRQEIILYPRSSAPFSPYNEVFGMETEMPFSPLNLQWKVKEMGGIDFLKATQEEAFLDAEKMGERWVLRQWRAGDWFIPLGMKGKGRKKVSDFLTSLKLSLNEKENVFVLCTERGEIAWVVGYRIDARFAITSQTRKVILFTLPNKKSAE